MMHASNRSRLLIWDMDMTATAKATLIWAICPANTSAMHCGDDTTLKSSKNT